MNFDQPDGPQLERGYTRIANELLEAILRYPLTGGELRILLAVIRLTYGWGRREAVLKIREIAQVAGLSERHAKRVVKRLTQDGLVSRQPFSRVRVLVGLNKRFSTWRLRKIPKTLAVTPFGTGCPQKSVAGVPRAGDSRVPPYKERNKKESL